MEEGKDLPAKNNLGLINKEAISSLENGWTTSQTLRFAPEILAYDKWQGMLDATNQDGLERGLTVAFDGDKLITGNVSKGTKDSSSLDLFPRGLRSIFSGREKNLVSIHTHPMPSELDHVQTVPVSDKDINAFINSTLKAMVTIDRGGVHLLTRNNYLGNYAQDEEHVLKITEESLKIAKEKGNTVIAVMREMANKLRSLGISYYYSPNLALNQDGFVEITNVLNKAE